MTILTLPKILAGALVFRLFLLLAGTEVVVSLDALLEVLDEHLIGVQYDAHYNSSNPSLYRHIKKVDERRLSRSVRPIAVVRCKKLVNLQKSSLSICSSES